MGVLVVLNDTIQSVRDVTKTATYRVETFQGRDLGPLGYADADGRVLYYHRPVRPHTTATNFDVNELGADFSRVDLVVSYVGADGSAIDAAVAAGARAIVLGRDRRGPGEAGRGRGPRESPGEERPRLPGHASRLGLHGAEPQGALLRI